jgi:probable rRNA maturation factor
MIQFSNQEIRFVLRNKLKIREWVKTILKEEGRRTGDIAYVFCHDEYLLKLNQQYLKHQTLTDIITFDYSEKDIISGDIFISLDRIKENSFSYSRSFEEELGRVMAHGILHLAGYKDKTVEDKKKMTEKENTYLVTYPNL